MMYPFGSNAINARTIGESAQGLADYVKQVKPDGPWRFGIAYDTRHRSREFAELCSSVMVANGFEVFFIDDYRSTPELSFLIVTSPAIVESWLPPAITHPAIMLSKSTGPVERS